MYSLEPDKYKEAVEYANQEGNVHYVSCQYLDKTIAPHGWGLEYPFGFYKLLSLKAYSENHNPRTIFVYGIKPENDYLLEANTSSVHRHWTNNSPPLVQKGGKIGKKKNQQKKNQQKKNQQKHKFNFNIYINVLNDKYKKVNHDFI